MMGNMLAPRAEENATDEQQAGSSEVEADAAEGKMHAAGVEERGRDEKNALVGTGKVDERCDDKVESMVADEHVEEDSTHAGAGVDEQGGDEQDVPDESGVVDEGGGDLSGALAASTDGSAAENQGLFEDSTAELTSDDVQSGGGQFALVGGGAIVVVTKEFLSDSKDGPLLRAREVGKVLKIDEEGDAWVIFQGGHGRQWVVKENFPKLRVMGAVDALDSECIPRETILQCCFDGHSFEEARWEWYRKQSKAQLLESASVPPSGLIGQVLFEHMSPTEVLSCKRFLPLEDYTSCLEASCGLKLAGREKRMGPTESYKGQGLCRQCMSTELLGVACGKHHPKHIVSEISEVREYECNHKGRCSTCLHCTSGPVVRLVESKYFACCGGTNWSEGCASRQHEFDVVSVRGKLLG